MIVGAAWSVRASLAGINKVTLISTYSSLAVTVKALFSADRYRTRRWDATYGKSTTLLLRLYVPSLRAFPS